jgi:hypothetical protein
MTINELFAGLERWLPKKRVDLFDRDSLMKTALPYYFLSVMTLVGLLVDEFHPFAFIALFYAGVPLLDELFSLDERNPDEEERVKLL